MDDTNHAFIKRIAHIINDWIYDLSCAMIGMAGLMDDACIEKYVV